MFTRSLLRHNGRLRLSLRLFLPALILLSLLARPAKPAAAHPLGNFSVNRYSRLQINQDNVELFYVVDMAEIPTFQTWAAIDTDGNEEIDAAENGRFLTNQLTTIGQNLELSANGRLLTLQPHSQRLTFPPGQGDLPTLRLEATFVAPLPREGNWNIAYHDHNFADRLGWREVVVQPGEGVSLPSSTALSEDVTQGLTSYPEDLLQSPLDVVSAQVEATTAVLPATSSSQTTTETAVSATNRFSSDEFANLLTGDGQLRGTVLFITLLTAFGLGAAHALTPGHGKTVVGAYLVGSRGTAKHAIFLGLTTTITHTAGVFLFGLIVLFASQFILPEQLYPWLGVISGLLVVWIGLSLVYGRWRAMHQPAYHHHHHDHDHDHDHAHDHDHDHDHDHPAGYHTHFGIGHTHAHPHNEEITWRNLLALGISGGLIPCPSALVVLLSAIALGRVALGLALITVFSLGLASVLTGIGLVLVYAGKLFQRLPGDNGRFIQAIPVLSALFITLVGLGITFRAFLDIGLI
ncbi:MAG: sulfite exporter TauE/SafE family protein [Chloroflexota bacterium]